MYSRLGKGSELIFTHIASWTWTRRSVRPTSSGHEECRERTRNPYYDPYHEVSIHGNSPRCYVGRKSLVTMASGVGVGPELMDVVRRVFACANAPVIFEELPMGPNSDAKDMENLVYSVERNGVAIKGNIEKALEPREMSRNMMMRRALDLFVNVIEVKSYPGLIRKMKLKKDMDVVMIRQNTEGEFAMLEHENGNGIEHLKITTQYNSRRLAQFAFEYAIKHKRPKVTVVYNKGFMNFSEGLFVESIAEVATRYPEIGFSRMSMREFSSSITKMDFNGQVFVTGVLYGGIILTLLFGLMHGQGLICGENLGSRYAVFEPAARNKGYKLSGKDLVNPVAALMCGIKLLRYLNHNTTANRIQRAVDLTINEDQVHTQDLGGKATTSEMVRNIEKRIREMMYEGFREEALPPLPPTPPPTQPYDPDLFFK